jgi:hypothetical protein
MEQNKNMTAVEWLADEISYNLFMWPNNTDYWMSGLVEKAKQMEKEQMSNFANEYADAVMGGCTERAEQYYNKAYGTE